MSTLDEQITADRYRLDQEVRLAYTLVEAASAWQRAVESGEGQAILNRTSELAALRGRFCGIMLRSVSAAFRDAGDDATADQLDTLSMKLGLNAVQYASEHNLPFASEE